MTARVLFAIVACLNGIGLVWSQDNAAIEREKTNWQNDLHLSVQSDESLSFYTPTDNPEEAKDGEVCNVHRLRFRIVQVQKDGFLASTKINDSSVIYWISGVSTKNISDGAYVRIVSPIIRNGNKSYTTLVMASKQVKHFRFRTKEEIEKANQQKEDRLRQQKQNEINRLPSYKLANGEEFRGTLFQIKKGKYEFHSVDYGSKSFRLDEFDEASQKAVLKALKELRK